MQGRQKCKSKGEICETGRLFCGKFAFPASQRSAQTRSFKNVEIAHLSNKSKTFLTYWFSAFLARDVPRARFAAKIAPCVKSFFGARQTLPADHASFARRRIPNVVMFLFAVAFGTARKGFVSNFRVSQIRYHMPTWLTSIFNKGKSAISY